MRTYDKYSQALRHGWREINFQVSVAKLVRCHYCAAIIVLPLLRCDYCAAIIALRLSCWINVLDQRTRVSVLELAETCAA